MAACQVVSLFFLCILVCCEAGAHHDLCDVHIQDNEGGDVRFWLLMFALMQWLLVASHVMPKSLVWRMGKVRIIATTLLLLQAHSSCMCSLNTLWQ